MKKLNLIFSVVAVAAMAITSCGESSGKASTTTNQDTTEKDTTNKITIGKQVWMVENLNVDIFRNDDPIPEVKTKDEWKKAGDEKKPAWSYYSDNSNNDSSYGKLYNWYAVNDPRGLAPEGWRIPSDKDWSALTDFLGGESVAGKKMKSGDLWTESEGGSGESGFLGLPGGCRNSFANFSQIGEYAYWWSSTDNGSNAWYRFLEPDNGYVGRSGFGNKVNGYSVRCLRD
ncbi:fibrobacter succinogenes major paralogous domain-containing protein [bacterium]|nr:fibrobacter succinogenes major paralogous domain-containing protein [bacterium]